MTTVSKRTAAGSDDAVDDNSEWPGYADTGTVIIGNADAQTLWAGLRFTGVNIPSGSTINSCTLSVHRPDWTGAGGEDVDVFFEEDAAPATFSSSDTPYDRANGGAALTAASVNWVMGADNGPGDLEVSPDLKTVLQEVVDDIGVQLDDIVLLLRGNVASAPGFFSSYDTSPTDAPLIDIDYTAGAGGGGAVRRRRLSLLGVGS